MKIIYLYLHNCIASCLAHHKSGLSFPYWEKRGCLLWKSMLVSYHLLFQLTPSEGRICITVFKKNYPKHRKKHNKTRMARNSCHAGAKTHQKFIWGKGLSYFCIIKFVGVTLVNKTIQVSSVQLNKTSAHCTVCPSPKVSFRPI